jgi:hypothetical protein
MRHKLSQHILRAGTLPCGGMYVGPEAASRRQRSESRSAVTALNCAQQSFWKGEKKKIRNKLENLVSPTLGLARWVAALVMVAAGSLILSACDGTINLPTAHSTEETISPPLSSSLLPPPEPIEPEVDTSTVVISADGRTLSFADTHANTYRFDILPDAQGREGTVEGRENSTRFDIHLLWDGQTHTGWWGVRGDLWVVTDIEGNTVEAGTGGVVYEPVGSTQFSAYETGEEDATIAAQGGAANGSGATLVVRGQTLFSNGRLLVANGRIMVGPSDDIFALSGECEAEWNSVFDWAYALFGATSAAFGGALTWNPLVAVTGAVGMGYATWRFNKAAGQLTECIKNSREPVEEPAPTGP